jgi:hypothetical protein
MSDKLVRALKGRGYVGAVELARLSGYDPSRVTQMCRAGLLPARRAYNRGRWRIMAADAQRFLDTLGLGGPTPPSAP